MGKHNTFGDYKYKFNNGEVITNNIGTKYRILNFKIIVPKNQSKYNPNKLWYYVECPKCGRTDWFESTRLMKKKCACETNNNHIIYQGINDVPATDYWMVDYFVGGIEEAKKYTGGSTKKVLMKCPYCGRTKMQEISVLKKDKRMYCVCSDNCSYPEKFLTSVLEQLNIDFISQATSNNLGFDVGKRAYDFYIPNLSCIIETHGNQHYADISFFNSYVNSIEENDNFKQQIALENGIKNYIVLDCRCSNLKWIKKSIMNSDMSKVFNFTEKDIDWNLCEKESATNLIKEVCDYYMRTMEKTRTIGEKFHKTYAMISSYLVKGDNIGWCVYDTKMTKGTRKPIKISNDIDTWYFYGVADITENSVKRMNERFDFHDIYDCIDTDKTLKGYHFSHITDPKEKCIALYGDRAVKWYEEHPEYAS